MAGRILVALRRSDRLEHVLPYLETIAQPDTKIVFLVHYAAGFERQLDEVFLVSGEEKTLRRRWRRFPDEKVSPNEADLSKLAAQIETAVYGGSFRDAVREYLCREDVHFVVVPTERSGWLRNFWQKLLFVQQPVNLPTLPSVSVFCTHKTNTG